MTRTSAPPPRPRRGTDRPLRATGDLQRVSYALPEHLAEWQLPPGWSWGSEGLWQQYRHIQEVIDALGRSLSLVTAPMPEHATWLTHR